MTTTSGREFISWQTWDLLRLMVYGFKNFALDFLEEHPGYFICPIRINGSAVETLFSQLKHATSSQLSSVNYTSAKATILTRGSVLGKRAGGYRSTPLYIRQHELKRK